MIAVDPHQPVARSDTAATAQIDGQLVALDVNSGVCFGLNRAATRIWNLIEAPLSPAEVSAALTEVYDVAPDVCAADTLAVLQELVDIGLARVVV